ncbi:phosphoethanolamine N-methyltransferase-like isoform X2 [Stegodyphus dumicola]|uniref:phosphoethanolamine N-methyltransferase-like isoform X2 n=1 Tax=Stegodyphus dumicola TaxID=202533 RepID=UPI0015A9C304|nr:phosphoethanolamine N-methyltransferase-like isoform X2 [Stegodyphus dumicola]
MSCISFATRMRMQEYWQKFDPSIESMMLDKTATIIHTDEQEEIFSLLPNLEGKHVLELGAGIGRYTGLLASAAFHVTAVDFMQDYINVNQQTHSHLPNINYIATDVLDLEMPPKKYDVVFSNWLFMYLSDQECISLLEKILMWLNDGGHLFFRESCFHSSGNMPRQTNPTFYRTPADYSNLVDAVSMSSNSVCLSNQSLFFDSEEGYGLKVISVGSLKAYIKHKNNSHQIYFLAKKVKKTMTSKDNFQHFLDKKQYSRSGVRRYEWIFGKTFLSTGGLTTTKKYVALLDLKEGQKVLDVGCGLGGHSFYMAENYGVEVLGVDLSVNMMTVATEHLSERPHLANKVKFVICDITRATYDSASFDAIYSRDTLLHIPNKEELFSNFERWLKPGGKILFTDYTKSDKEISPDFENYIADRGYHLLTLNQYKELLGKSGFTNIKVEDATEEFLNALHAELNKLRTQKESFLKEFTEDDYRYLEDGWTAKIKRVVEGNQTWTACYAEKPRSNE